MKAKERQNVRIYFKQRCLELIRRVEATGKPVTITRRGKVVAQLEPPPAATVPGVRPWERLRGKARWLAEPGERFISERPPTRR